MCGITGLVQPCDAQASRAIVVQMTAALAHRGPDASKNWTDGPVALGHRRLSILDLSETGAQPMHSDCGRSVLAYNGEIYNHHLRRDLATAGNAHDWNGHSDTETLLAGFSHWDLGEKFSWAFGFRCLN